MNKQNKNWSRRKFFRASSLVLGAAILPSSLLASKATFNKAILGSSISLPISYKGKTIGVKFTMVNNSYVVATIRVPKGKKMAHFSIEGPFAKEKSSSGTKASVKMKDGISGSVTVDSRKGTFTTSVKGVKIGRVKFENSKDDDIPSAQGFIQWFGDKIADAAKIVAAGITWVTGNEGIWNVGNGSIIVSKGGGILVQSGFMSEDGVEEQPGIWY